MNQIRVLKVRASEKTQIRIWNTDKYERKGQFVRLQELWFMEDSAAVSELRFKQWNGR